jgi:hypothetical protein
LWIETKPIDSIGTLGTIPKDLPSEEGEIGDEPMTSLFFQYANRTLVIENVIVAMQGKRFLWRIK